MLMPHPSVDAHPHLTSHREEELLQLQQVATLEMLGETKTKLAEVMQHLENAEVLQVLGASADISLNTRRTFSPLPRKVW
jgi:hypothetical protein